MAKDSTDWQAWIQRHGPIALLYALQIAGTRADAEDAVNEGFVRFWKKRAIARNVPALFFACVRSAALDARRSLGRRRNRERSAFTATPLLAGPDQGHELREHIERALRQLPEAQREVVVLKIWGNLSFAQIAEILAESPDTLASRYRYAMRKLEILLSPECEHGT